MRALCVPERIHFQRWDEESAGWHGWTQPTQEQIKARMLARRNHKQEGTT
ncbi:hypothetical protein [Actinomadura sp. CNU-125]|nr:hypothetical protein [Actinomadura sp. CNU-125]